MLMPVIFEYEPRDTVIHRLNPISKVVAIISLLIITSLYWDLKYLFMIFLVAFTLYVISKTPQKWLLLAIPFCAYRFIEVMILGLALSDPRYYKVMPPELASRVLAQIGPITLIYGGFVWALGNVFKIVITMMLTFMFIYTTPLNELIKSLASLKVHRLVVYMVTIALRFVPDLWREIKLTSMAQSLRGWSLKTKNPVKLAKMSAPIVNPFTRKIIDYVDRIALTVQIRGFGTRNVRYMWRLEFKLIDWFVLISSVMVLGVALYALVAYQIGLI